MPPHPPATGCPCLPLRGSGCRAAPGAGLAAPSPAMLTWEFWLVLVPASAFRMICWAGASWASSWPARAGQGAGGTHSTHSPAPGPGGVPAGQPWGNPLPGVLTLPNCPPAWVPPLPSFRGQGPHPYVPQTLAHTGMGRTPSGVQPMGYSPWGTASRANPKAQELLLPPAGKGTPSGCSQSVSTTQGLSWYETGINSET